MSTGKTIKINTEYLENCNGNLRKLKEEKRKWKRSGQIFNKSKGSARGGAEIALIMLDNCSEEFDTVISNSVSFFENIGFSFIDADENLSKAIKNK